VHHHNNKKHSTTISNTLTHTTQHLTLWYSFNSVLSGP